MDSRKAIYGMPRLLNALSSMTGNSPDDVIGALVNDVKCFTGNAPRSDDMTMIAFSVLGSGS
jgi:serine phosphatase RsbU (regulator of sigma subunit)